MDAYGDAHFRKFQQHYCKPYKQSGQVISWSSAGKMGFVEAKKNTPYAAQMAAADAAKVAFDAGLKEWMFCKRTGSGREGAIRSFHNQVLR